jgi:uncharacterized protein YjbI with pentapeptide repeats
MGNVTKIELKKLSEITSFIKLDISTSQARHFLENYNDNCNIESITPTNFNDYILKKFKTIKTIEDDLDLHNDIDSKNWEFLLLNNADDYTDDLAEYIKFRQNYPELYQQYQINKNKLDAIIIVAEITSSDAAYSLGHTGKLGNDFGVKVKNGDFSGCRIVNINIANIENVSFKDCDFEKVKFSSTYIENVDFRGANLEECSFVNFSKEETKLKGNKFSFSDEKAGENFGFIRVFDEAKFKLLNHQSTQKILSIQEEEIKRIPKKIKHSRLSRLILGGEKSEYDEQAKLQIAEIEKKYKKRIEKAKSKNKLDCIIIMQNSVLDSMYVPGKKQSVLETKFYKVIQADLDDFKKTKNPWSFNSFLKAKLSDTKNALHKEYSECNIIADFRDLDLKNIDLSGLDLRGSMFAYYDLGGVNFSNVNLEGSCFEGAIFNHATKFNNANLTDCNLAGVEGEGVDFSDSKLLRARMHSCKLINSIFNNAEMYLVNAYEANFSGSKMEKVDLEKSKLKGAVLRSVDAKYASMKMANLERAILDYANFFKADFTNAILTEVSAEYADFSESVMINVNAELANFRGAILTKIQAQGADFSEADLLEIQAEYADFTDAILARVKAEGANFSKTKLDNVQAQGANFTEALFIDASMTSADLNSSTLDRINATRANLESSLMTRVQAEGANFTDAILKKVDLEFSICYKAIFANADLTKANVYNAILTQSDLTKTKLEDIKYNESTILINTNLQNAIDASPELKKLYMKNCKSKTGIFARSKYGVCKDNSRFELQALGAKILFGSATVVTSTILFGSDIGVTSTALMTVATGVMGAVIGKKSADLMKYYSYNDLGYIDNILGDKLAEVGLICKVIGLETINSSLDAMFKRMLLSSLILSVSQQTNSSLPNLLSFSNIVFSANIIFKAGYSGYKAWKELESMQIDDNGNFIGLPPEELDKKFQEKLAQQKEYYLPTIRKFYTATLITAATILVVTGAASLMGGAALSTAIISPILISTSVCTAFLAYKYDKNIINMIPSFKQKNLKEEGAIEKTYTVAKAKKENSASQEPRKDQKIKIEKKVTPIKEKNFVNRLLSSLAKNITSKISRL